jgi:membrane protease YdiL (CAAX protease family)
MSFLAPLISAVIFGFSHIVNIDLKNALFNVAMGLVWGYVRYYNKKATFTAMFMAHGVSDILTIAADLLAGFTTEVF